MFYKLKRWLRSKNTQEIDCLKYKVQTLEKHLERLSDELTLIDKLVAKKEVMTVKVPDFICLGGNTDKKRDQVMAENRDRVRLAGYSFCHKMKNGEEIWAKY